MSTDLRLPQNFKQLTRELLIWLAQGASLLEAAKALEISPRTAQYLLELKQRQLLS